MSRTSRALLCLALAAPMSVGASAALAQSPSPDPVLGQELHLTEMAGTAVSPDSGITATFAADATLAGFGGCNRYDSTWQSDGTTLTIAPIAMTRMSCGPDMDALENQYLGLLGAAASWSLNGSALEIVTSDGSTLVYGGEVAGPAIVGAWQLTTFGGTPVPSGIVASAIFGPDGTLTGTGGCNTFSGTYTVDGSSLSVSRLAATRMTCADAGEIEPAYLDTLEAATSWAVDGSSLTIGGTYPLVFRSVAPAAITLTGQPWALVTMGDQTVDPSTGVTATFADDGTISGSGGCNQYHSTYTLDGDTIAIEPVALTRMSCGEDVNATESAFVAALETSATLVLSGSDLVITTKDGTELTFQVQAGPPPSPSATADATTAPTAEPTTEPAAGASPAASGASPAASPGPGASAGASAGIVGSWKMTEMMGTALPSGMLKVTVDIAADGTLTGSGGCNEYHATWSLSGTTLALGGLVTDTGAPCDPTTQSLEQSYFGVLPYLDTAEVQDGKLVLGSSFSPSITFTFAPAG